MPYDHISSGAAYHDTTKPTRDHCRQKVFTAIRKLQPCTDKQIGAYLGWEINKITGRRGELIKGGLVVQDHKGMDPTGKRLVSYWKEKGFFATTLF